MDNKRKSSAANGATAELDERAVKRQRLTEKYNLNKQETVESTTEHGLFFLEQIRRTADKNGRKVAGYFEKLLPRESNPEYYKKTRMPISLTMIEKKLNNGEFTTLTELESYFKRMVSNAKEFYPRNTQIFEDAERVRKALSNYMTKTNPAYSRGGYTAVPTPLPPDGVVDEAEEDDIDIDVDGSQPATGRRKSHSSAKALHQQDYTEDEEEEPQDEDEEDEDAEAEEEEEEDDAEGEDDDDEASQASKPTAIIIRRRGPGRPPRAASGAQRKPKTQTATPSRPDSRPDGEYEGIQYKGLTFQAAQEKIVEEMLRKRDEGVQEAYFEPFVNLPPRSLKDYYKAIKEPISLKKLQKAIKGIKGRSEATGVSEFKSWSAFEEKASLLWENAFYYNEEGSEIYDLAQELKDFFINQLKQAKAVVPEPSQPKIKLKVGQPSSEQPATSKKITIHVGGKSDSADSPAPLVPRSAGSQVSDQAPVNNGTARPTATPAVSAAMDRLRSTSVASPSPSLANNVKREDVSRPSPAVTPGNANTPSVFAPPAGQIVGMSNAHFQPIGGPQTQPSQTNGIQQPPKPLWDQRSRAPGKGAADALISSLKVQTHPMINVERRFEITLKPLEKESQLSATVQMPSNQLRVQIIPILAALLEKEARQYRLWVLVNRHIIYQTHAIPGQVLPLGARVFEAQLQAGIVNTIEVHVAAALPKGQKLPSGADFEVEQMTVLANVVRN
ncbi:Chromatin structure-remodeling complex subunit rsc1-like protein 2 [Colletotrichum chlorophyti]|uniref:Chromatin structure-remodeling complex subunit rsc1-like protein 2 n=1 Tax=Colletotrichum chlorophyti TaxID=708187 RepID=A0A1Q8REX7_9PEZI|nr:Chromatin structure-remodeling complex subunit rsc1-like protein 2 [Colletotrichum chlorophyti]